jgi:hypothetical protein
MKISDVQAQSARLKDHRLVVLEHRHATESVTRPVLP